MNKISVFVFLLFLILASLSFANVIWTYNANDGINTKTIINGNYAVTSSRDGILHVVSLASGQSVWEKDIGEGVLQPVLFDGDVVTATNPGIITRLKRSGNIAWQVDLNKTKKVSLVYGITTSEVNGTLLYVTTDKGIFIIERSGNVSLFFNGTVKLPYTQPTVFNNIVIFGAGDELIAVKNSSVLWRNKVANFWSKPYVDNNKIYIGALDNALYAFDLTTGKQVWRYETLGWVTGTPLVQNKIIYFGSNDGNIYALDAETASLKWKVKTAQAIQTTPLAVNFAGKQAIAIGGNDGKLYIIDSDGNIIWKFNVGEWVGSPIEHNDSIIFGSKNGLLYSIKTDKGCIINKPEEGTKVGQKEVKIEGTAISRNDDLSVSVRLNDQQWEEVKLIDENWKITIDPNNMKVGVNLIQCKVSDINSEEKEPYVSTFLIKTQDTPKSKFVISAPKTVEQGKEFTINVSDADDKAPVENFKIDYNGKQQTGNGNATLTIDREGKIIVKITKPGYEDASLNVEVKSSSIGASSIFDLALPIIIGIIILALLYFFVIKRFLGNKDGEIK